MVHTTTAQWRLTQKLQLLFKAILTYKTNVSGPVLCRNESSRPPDCIWKHTHTTNLTQMDAATVLTWAWLATVMVVTHSQETCTRNLYKSTWTRNLTVWHGFLYKSFSCTSFLHRIQHSTAQYSVQETCMHVTRMVSSDWSAAYRCHYFHFVVFMLLTICCTKLI